jgi:hypothetical protein
MVIWNMLSPAFVPKEGWSGMVVREDARPRCESATNAYREPSLTTVPSTLTIVVRVMDWAKAVRLKSGSGEGPDPVVEGERAGGEAAAGERAGTGGEELGGGGERVGGEDCGTGGGGGDGRGGVGGGGEKSSGSGDGDASGDGDGSGVGNGRQILKPPRVTDMSVLQSMIPLVAVTPTGADEPQYLTPSIVR